MKLTWLTVLRLLLLWPLVAPFLVFFVQFVSSTLAGTGYFLIFSPANDEFIFKKIVVVVKPSE